MSSWQRRKEKLRRQRKKGGDNLKLVPKGAIVAICIPSDDHVHAAFCLSLIHMAMRTMVANDSGITGMTVQHVGASILPHSRYTLVKKALEQNATHLLFVDSDMTFPGDTVTRLLKHDVDMVGVNAMSRRPPYHTTAWIEPGKRAVTDEGSAGLEKVWRTGFAVVMIKAEVFRKMAPPYFDIQYIPETDEFRGEDYIFFDRARQAGFDLYIDHDLSKEVNHVGSFAFNPLLANGMQQAQIMSEETAKQIQTA